MCQGDRHVWRSEGSLWESVLCFRHIGPSDGTQAIGLSYPGGSGKPSSLWRAPFPGWDPGCISRESELSTSIHPSLLPDSEWGVSSCLRLLAHYLPATMRYAFYSELKQKLLSFKWILDKLEYLFP